VPTPLAALHVRTMILLYMALRRAPSKCRATAAGAERLVARADARDQILPCPDHAQGCGEVTSPLFSITSILNATSYDPGDAIRGCGLWIQGAGWYVSKYSGFASARSREKIFRLHRCGELRC
jgi:hypothetical protein